MPNSTVLTQLLAADLISPDDQVPVQVPTWVTPGGSAPLWHPNPNCDPMVDSHTRLITAAELHALAVDPDSDMALCTCGTWYPGVYVRGIDSDTIEALAWLVDIDQALLDPGPFGRAALRTLTAHPPASPHPGVTARIEDALTAAAARIADPNPGPRWLDQLAGYAVAGYRDLVSFLTHDTVPPPGLHSAVVWCPGVEAEATALVADPDGTGALLLDRWDGHWRGHRRDPDLAAMVLARFAGPRVWAIVPDEPTRLLGAADTADYSTESDSWLIRAPLAMVCAHDRDVDVVALDAGYTPDLVRTALRMHGRTAFTPDLIAALQVAAT